MFSFNQWWNKSTLHGSWSDNLGKTQQQFSGFPARSPRSESSDEEKKINKPKTKDILQNNWLEKKRLKNYSRLKETKETGWSNALCNPILYSGPDFSGPDFKRQNFNKTYRFTVLIQC